MYLDYFGLREQPFGVTPDPAFFYLSPTHREALESLRSDLVNDRGFMTLIGEPGLGKTTLLYKLLGEWKQSCRVVFLFQTQCNSQEFFRYLLAELGIDAESMGLVAMHHKLNNILFQEMLAGNRFVLIVDEAQNLDNSVLETVRGLSNFETEHSKLVNIVLAGQSQLAAKLDAPELKQLRQRIGVLNRLRPLDACETAEYINHRLAVVGYVGDSIFTSDALDAIAQASEGNPRRINHICHQALSAAVTKGVRTVDLEMARNAIARLEGRTIEAVPSLEAPAVETPVSPDPAPVSAAPPDPGPLSGSPVRPYPPSAMLLSYGSTGSRNKTYSKVRGIAAIACCILLLAGAAYAIPSVRRFAEQEYKNLSWNSHKSSDSGVASNPVMPPSSEVALASYDPDAQGDPSAQVITVSSKSGQTIEQLSLLYSGHFDQQTYQQISALNPEVKNFDSLEAGQLIRLPLPPGTLKKAVDTADSPEATESGKWHLAVAKIKELFSPTKR